MNGGQFASTAKAAEAREVMETGNQPLDSGEVLGSPSLA